MVENVLQKYNILFKPSADIPAYAVMESTGSETVNHEICVDTQKFSNTTSIKTLLVNGPMTVTTNTYGRCAMAADRPLVVLGTGNSGQIVGPSNNSTSLSVGYPGFVCIGTSPVSGTVVAQRVQNQQVIGKLDGALSNNSSAVVSVWTGAPNSESDSDDNITAYDWLMKDGADDIASGKKVVCEAINFTWYVTEAECP